MALTAFALVASSAQVSYAIKLDEAEQGLNQAFDVASKTASEAMDYLKDKWFDTTHPATPICIVTGSEKVEFLNKIKGDFEKKYSSTVTVVSAGSLAGADMIVKGTKTSCVPTIWSPASSAYEKRVMAGLRQAKLPPFALVIPQTVKSPIVLMLRNKAYRTLPAGIITKDASGESFSFANLAEAMANGKIRIAVTNPGESNSGFMSLLLAVIEKTKKDTIDAADLDSDENLSIAKQFFSKAINDLNKNAVGKKNPFNGSGDLFEAFTVANSGLNQVDNVYKDFDGIVTYESLAVNAITNGVSGYHIVYPSTNVMSDHPAYVLTVPVNDSMNSDQKAVAAMIQKRAKAFALYMIDAAQQKEAVSEGFRQGLPKTRLNLNPKDVWPDEVFTAGAAADLGSANVLVARKIEGEVVDQLREASEAVVKK